ncbi:NAD(+) diphosphatase [Agromyces cerinus]|uniref:NAD(+) diphosphatase n=1 Tax=Agromyces cerinus subsp. cerinus TaxID=232089 RepID=A0A1N6HLR0_9MICO|nr:NAD(+) diphosphatase [Agromyces cerinus]SIO20609.1 NAD+ diphosphatase [Agromyces cerinus subsp. cerinus]
MIEATSPVFARSTIDRDAVSRADPELESSLDADPETRVVAVHRGQALLEERVDGSAPALQLTHPHELPEPMLRCYLGREGGSRFELRVFDADAAAVVEPEAARWQGLREAAAVLGDRDAGLLVEAIAIANWHERHGHCPSCGAETVPVQAGWARRCTVDDSLHFPRTDPAVIVLVTDDDDRVLLGSNAVWAQHRYSLLAGFVEPGEPFEAAVVREIEEEAGILVDRVEYVASQPWPFPASLMVGFTARIAPGVEPASAAPDGEEILSLRWFSRDEIVAAHGEVGLPGGISIARWLLERWFGGPLDAEGTGLAWSTS